MNMEYYGWTNKATGDVASILLNNCFLHGAFRQRFVDTGILANAATLQDFCLIYRHFFGIILMRADNVNYEEIVEEICNSY